MSNIQDKTKIRSIVICGKQRFMQKNLFTVGIVTDKMQYIEHEFIVMKNVMTQNIANRLAKIFQEYSFDKYSDICMTDETMADNAFVMYLRMIANHYNVPFETLHDTAILLRLVNMHSGLVGKSWKEKHLYQWKIDPNRNLTSENIDKTHIPTLYRKIWNAFLRKNICPWIDQDVDLSIQLGEPRFRRQRQRVRLAAYYLVCRRYIKLRNQKVQA